jgi:hypothetical protein
MQMPARELAALASVVIAGCAQAPAFDEGLFDGIEPVLFDAGQFDAGAVPLDADLGGVLGPQVLGSIDASGGTSGGGTRETGVPAPSIADAATSGASDAATVSGEADAGGSEVDNLVPITTTDAAGAESGTQAVANAGAADASSGTTARDAAAALCSAQRCRNNCLALPRCCNDDNECACFDPGTRQCSLPSL